MLVRFEFRQRERTAFNVFVIHIQDSKFYDFVFLSNISDDHSILQIVQAFALQIRFLVTLHRNSILEGLFVSFITLDGGPVIEVHTQSSRCCAPAAQFQLNTPQITLMPVRCSKANPHSTLLVVEVDAIQPTRREVKAVEVWQVVQWVNAAIFLGPTFPELEMKMG